MVVGLGLGSGVSQGWGQGWCYRGVGLGVRVLVRGPGVRDIGLALEQMVPRLDLVDEQLDEAEIMLARQMMISALALFNIQP